MEVTNLGYIEQVKVEFCFRATPSSREGAVHGCIAFTTGLDLGKGKARLKLRLFRVSLWELGVCELRTWANCTRVWWMLGHRPCVIRRARSEGLLCRRCRKRVW